MEKLGKILNLNPKIQKNLVIFNLKKELEKRFGKLNFDFRNQTLNIYVKDGATLEELSFKKEEILKKLKETLPSLPIKDIKVKRA
jgi:hypothetical protein